MTIGPEIEQEFNKIVEVAVQEAGNLLTNKLGQSVDLNFSRLIDSTMTSDKVAIKADSVMVAVATNQGPMSLIIADTHAINIANIVQANIEEKKEELGEEELGVVSDLFSTAVDGVISSFKAQHEALDISAEPALAKLLKLEDDASLELPEGVNDSVGMGLKLKLDNGLEMGFQIELNSAMIEHLVSELGSVKLEVQTSSNISSAEEGSQAAGGEVSGTTSKTEDLVPGTFDPRRNLSFLRSVNMELVLELGRSEMPVRDILTLTRGSAIELDRPCDRPVDLYVHNQLVARGEVVAIDDSFGFKITELTGNLDLAEAASRLQPD